MQFGQKFDVVSESHWFSYDYFIFNGVIALNAWWYIYALGSNAAEKVLPFSEFVVW